MTGKPVIGIDARMHGHSGIGTYITMLLTHIEKSQRARDYNFMVFSGKRLFDGRFLHVGTNSRLFSFFEQIELASKKHARAVTLFHSPQFNIPLLSPVPQVTTIHDCAYTKFPEEFGRSTDRLLYAAMFRVALRKSKKIIAVSAATREELTSLFGIPREKVRVIHEGVDHQFFRHTTPEERRLIRQRYRIEGDFALFVGLARPRKNIERILLAFAAARPSLHPALKLVVAGPLETRFVDIRKKAQELGIGDVVVQTGFIDHTALRALYASAVCLFLPTLYEGFGLPLLEAMAAGLPVITSARPAHMEIAGDAGLLVDPLAVEEMARALIRMTSDKGLREDYTRRGMERTAEFSWERCAAETIDVYDEVLNG